VTIHQGIAVRADGNKVAVLFGNGAIIRHAAGRQFRGTAADAVEFPRLTGPLVFQTARFEEIDQDLTEDRETPVLSTVPVKHAGKWLSGKALIQI
jgi:uncharacterized protein (DUF2345 family)